ncbi:nucleoside recognition domain-containing protein [Endozoicomonas lisbonensis]|uniref:Nucleoside recognition membrane protein YjiH n=1 Tax=Endozoicomonas lisbonensis TaxID=3120522 RepID=A0ABV2SIU9_9GAMM
MANQHSHTDERTGGIGGYISLFTAIVFFSGVLQSDQWWGVLDFTTMNGAFGSIIDGVAFRGTGGSGARDGFLFALGLVPTCMFALGMVRIFEHFGALEGARSLLTPILRAVMGIPGVCGLTMIASLQNTDTAASMTKLLHEKGELNNKEMHIFTAFQFSCGATIVNFMGSGAVLLTLTNADGSMAVPSSIGMILGVIMICKVLGANILRFYLNHLERKGAFQSQANNKNMEVAHG